MPNPPLLIPGPELLKKLRDVACPARANNAKRNRSSYLSTFSDEQLWEVSRMLAAGVGMAEIVRHVQGAFGLCLGAKMSSMFVILKRFKNRLAEQMPEILEAAVTGIEKARIKPIENMPPFHALDANQRLILDIKEELTWWKQNARERGLAPFQYCASLYKLLGERITADIELRQQIDETESKDKPKPGPSEKGLVQVDKLLMVIQKDGGTDVQDAVNSAKRHLRAIATRELPDESG